MIEVKREMLKDKYGDIIPEIDKILLWWKVETGKFEIPNDDPRVGAPTKYATHGDVYDLLSYHKKPGIDIPDEVMRKRNEQLFNMLRNEFGWKEESELLFPDPENIF